FSFEERGLRGLAWASDCAFMVSSHYGDVFRFWDTRKLARDRPIARAVSVPVPRDLSGLPSALAALHGVRLHPPLCLLRDLLRLVAGQPVSEPAGVLASEPGIQSLAALKWPAAARIGLVAWLLRAVPLEGWQPPAELSPGELSDRLAEALAGEPIDAVAP